jgi:Spy/CpxP family protein refolding chaperone
MKHLKPILAALAASAIISVAVAAHAADSKDDDESGHRHHQRGEKCGFDGADKSGDVKHSYTERRGPLFDKVLDLTDSQKKTLESAHSEQEASQKAFHEKLRTAHEALDKAGDANADDATLNKLSGELASLIAQQEVNRVKARRQFLSLLTSEQKQKLDAFEAEHKGPRQWKQKRQDAPQVK